MDTRQRILMEALDEARITRGLPKRRVERRLRLSPGYYCLLQQGKRRLQIKHVRAILRWFPELRSQVSLFLGLKDANATETDQG